MRIIQYMTRKVLVGHPKDGVRQTFFLMRSEGVRHLPVVDDAQRLVGIISDRDLRRPDWVDEDFMVSHPYKLDDGLLIEDLMTRAPMVVHTYDSIGKAVEILAEHRFGALPVLDREERLVGILSAYDLLNAMGELLGELRGGHR